MRILEISFLSPFGAYLIYSACISSIPVFLPSFSLFTAFSISSAENDINIFVGGCSCIAWLMLGPRRFRKCSLISCGFFFVSRNKMPFLIYYLDFFHLSELSLLASIYWKNFWHVTEFQVPFLILLFLFHLISSVLFVFFLSIQPYDFLMFSGGRERLHWERMG